MTNSYIIGNQIKLSASFTNNAGSLVNPTSVSLVIKKPDRTIETITPTNDSTGKYHFNYTPTMVGDYCYRFEATGSVVAASQNQFKITGKC